MGDFPNKDSQWKPGQSGNPAGVPKGTVQLSTIIKQLMQDTDWDIIPVRKKDDVTKKYGKRGWTAITAVAVAQAMNGDAQARRWLSESAYGKNIDFTSDGKALPIPILGGAQPMSTKKPTTTEGGDGSVSTDNSNGQNTPSN